MQAALVQGCLRLEGPLRASPCCLLHRVHCCCKRMEDSWHKDSSESPPSTFLLSFAVTKLYQITRITIIFQRSCTPERQGHPGQQFSCSTLVSNSTLLYAYHISSICYPFLPDHSCWHQPPHPFHLACCTLLKACQKLFYKLVISLITLKIKEAKAVLKHYLRCGACAACRLRATTVISFRVA